MPRRSKAEIYLHFVWATYRRMPLISPTIEQQLYACMLNQAQRLGCEVLAIGGMADHVHLAVHASPKVSPSNIMQQVKGVSSVAGRDLVGSGELFGWQDGYGVFSFSRSHQTKVIAYIRDQKEHHSQGQLWHEWEETGEEQSG